MACINLNQATLNSYNLIFKLSKELSCSKFLFPCSVTFHSSSFHREIEKETKSALKTITMYFCSFLEVKCNLDIF